MSISLEQLQTWMDSTEGEHLEFKEAKNRFDFASLTKYCVALANEGGGHIILGVTDVRPRRVVGSYAFTNLERTKRGLTDRLRLRIEINEVLHPDGRVLVFHVPSRPVGMPAQFEGTYWMRRNDSLVPMTADRLRAIFAESGHDFSADVCPDVTLADLDPAAIEEFRRHWIAKSGNQTLATLSQEQLLSDAEALVDGNPTFAALILFGTSKTLGRHLAQAEITFEYRSSDASGPAQDRKEYRRGFFAYYDELWKTVNLRNDRQHYQDGLFVYDIPTFSERPVREAILNAVSHRNYQLGGNVFIRQYARRLEITSPGGFPPEINLQNILDRQSPRNRRIADIFCKCGLVERSGQGMNLMFEQSIQQSKPLPDFTGTDQYQVCLTLRGNIENPEFIRFLEQIGRETLEGFSTRDWLLLDQLSHEKPIPKELRPRIQDLIDIGAVERVGRGKVILSCRYYKMVGKKGVYTRKKGLDRDTNKALLLKHIKDNQNEGSPLHELTQVLPGLSRPQVQTLLRELRDSKQIHPLGRTKASRWHPGLAPEPIESEDPE